MAYIDVVILILAYLVASVLNLVIYRLPLMLEDKNRKLNLFFPGSHCPQCQHPIRYWHNIPIFGYLLLKGKCKDCKAAIPKRYLFIEIIYPLMVYLFSFISHDSLQLGIFAWIWALLLTLAVIDWETMILPDPLNYILIWSGLLINLDANFCPINEAIWGAITGYLSLWLFYHIYRLATGKQGFGYGDFKLFAGLGSCFGIYALFPILMLACVLGILLYLTLAIKAGKQSLQEAKPFGPMLAASGVIYMFTVTLVPRLIGI